MLCDMMHPTNDDLKAFSTGQLPAVEIATLEDHIRECESCCETLLAMSDDDSFAVLLQRSSVDDEHRHGRDDLQNNPRYEIAELIARGGMGDVFKAKHRVMDRIVALKIIKPELMRRPEVIQRFHREVKTAAQLSHRNIVTAYDADQFGDVHFLVMEYVDGINLAQRVRRDGAMPVAQACDAIGQAAAGLQHAHDQGMVHRDIKPHNLMQTPDGSVKVLDFGLASLVSETMMASAEQGSTDSKLTSAGTLMGTPDFIAPEQAADARQADIRSDIYSLGATLHYLLVGRPPFDAGSVADRIKDHAETQPAVVSELRPDVPMGLSDVISRMMAKDPDDRFQTPCEVEAAILPFTQPTAARVGHGRRPPIKWIALAMAAFACLAAGVIYVKTDKGTLKIDALDDGVEVTISKAIDGDGHRYVKVLAVDTVTGTEVQRLRSGDYEVSLGEASSKFELTPTGFTLRRGKEVVVKVTRKTETASDPTKAEPEDIDEVLSMPIPSSALLTLTSEGRRLTPDQIAAMETKAQTEGPEQLESKLRLLGYYQSKNIMNKELRKPHANLMAELVDRYPESMSRTIAHMHASIDPVGYMQVKQVWLKQTKDHPKNATILGNAAAFFLLSERDEAEALFKRAKALAPEEAQYAEQLGNLYLLSQYGKSKKQTQKDAAAALVEFETAMKLSASDRNSRVYAAKAAYVAGNTAKATQYAEQLIATDDENSKHQGHTILGNLAIADGKTKIACEHLLASGRVTGAPNLNSFGPSMKLADALLRAGETKVVLEYLELCGKFWKNPQLDQWIATIKGGGAPDFGRSMNH
ncbi:Serine/threonine-protein kinase PrkC [Rubripirellula tenax]|uniref:Serine/threonine-protein kinase PrkC n=1 Tax=Rubripirellula tenax TaxID=2528015 RepID=A0A5C6FH80_9BACT|nr:serine/threonine-protein kinase [Rubripirellula tenax]TWU60225.1 Serine/threonine-protein kinase PrkC [Rubripirellula tenax]